MFAMFVAMRICMYVCTMHSNTAKRSQGRGVRSPTHPIHAFCWRDSHPSHGMVPNLGTLYACIPQWWTGGRNELYSTHRTICLPCFVLSSP